MLWLILAFLANGAAQFLQKYLHASGFGSFQSSALITMYVAGAVFGLILLIGFGGKVGRSEALFGVAVGICSYAGNFAVLRALGSLPAYTVFPIIVGVPILLVAAYGRLFGGERLSNSGKLGILCGVAAVALLTVG
jgi:drug/metabolite transporter (DMT)-like permease